MKHFRNRFILLFISLGGLLLARHSSIQVFAALFGICFSMLNFYLDTVWFRLSSLMIFYMLCMFFPDFILLLPLALYEHAALAANTSQRKYLLLLIFPILLIQKEYFTFTTLFFLTGTGLLSFILFYDTREYLLLWEQYKQTRDDSTERNLLLSEKNKNLLEKQDYEIYAATLKERNRIAREIHDNVGHLLSRSILMTGALKAVSREPSLKEPLDALDQTLSQAMDSVRESVHDLHDDAVNLEADSKKLIRDFPFCPVTCVYDMGRNIPVSVKYCFLAVLKEALSNIIRHSDATKVSVTMREHPGLYQLCIEDNGSPKMVLENGIGLKNMEERVLLLNGCFRIHTENGFRIFITIPKE